MVGQPERSQSLPHPGVGAGPQAAAGRSPEPEDSRFVGDDQRGDQEQRRKRAPRRRPVRGRPVLEQASRSAFDPGLAVNPCGGLTLRHSPIIVLSQ